VLSNNNVPIVRHGTSVLEGGGLPVILRLLLTAF